MLAKVVGGGFPVGAIGGRREIMDLLAPIGPVYQAGTFSGNPVGMIAGLTTLELWSADQFNRVSALTDRLVTGIKELATMRDLPCWTDSRGTMGGYFFTDLPVTDLTCAERADKNLFKRFYHGLLQAGIYLPQSPYESLFLSAAHTEDLIADTLTKIELVFSKL
jgi:glutamate-1-semialdehyde 2,1-aminomutase